MASTKTFLSMFLVMASLARSGAVQSDAIETQLVELQALITEAQTSFGDITDFLEIDLSAEDNGPPPPRDDVVASVNKMRSVLESLDTRAKVLTRLMAIDLSQYTVSDVYKNRSVYIASRWSGYDLQDVDMECGEQGGYLAEIDDNEESQFVFDFGAEVGGTDRFLVGGNDVDSEGEFVYFHSGKPVPANLTWMAGEPNNIGNEDCMVFWIPEGGLNDVPCNYGNNKFVCEIPLISG